MKRNPITAAKTYWLPQPILYFILGLSLGCPKPGYSPGLSRGQVDDLGMMEFMLKDLGGYNFKLDLRDLDNNGAIDLHMKLLSGKPGETTDDILENAGMMTGTLMAGCGYEIDKLCVVIEDREYRAPFRKVADCALKSFDEGTEANENPVDQGSCLADLWKVVESK